MGIFDVFPVSSHSIHIYCRSSIEDSSIEMVKLISFLYISLLIELMQSSLM